MNTDSAALVTEIDELAKKVTSSATPEDLAKKILLRLSQLKKLTTSPSFMAEFDRMENYLDWVASLPWQTTTKDVLDLERTKEVLDSHHYGLDSIKNRILEYISIAKLQEQKPNGESIARAPILCFVGLVGTGKTTIASSIAEAMGRKFARIPFGGMGDPLDLRGLSRLHPEAEPGRIIKTLRQTGSKNPVILLDEIDRVAEEGRSSIMGVLVELLDPEQNHAFTDYYIDYPFDLSNVLFVATANNTTNIATAVMDRLEPISMPSYTDQEKIVIAQKYLLPKALKEAGIPENALSFDENVWPLIVRPLGFDAGIRTLERNLKAVVRKFARMYVEGKNQNLKVTSENVKDLVSEG